jgi:hypothetical protein
LRKASDATQKKQLIVPARFAGFLRFHSHLKSSGSQRRQLAHMRIP